MPFAKVEVAEPVTAKDVVVALVVVELPKMPETKLPILPHTLVAKEFVDVALPKTAVVAKRLVVVAFVVVLRVAIKSAKVCVTVQVLAAVTVAKYPASAVCARPLVKYRFDPSATFVVRRPKEEVATWVHVFPAPPRRSWFCVTEESPVPPRLPERVPVVLDRSMFKVEVAVVPKCPVLQVWEEM